MRKISSLLAFVIYFAVGVGLVFQASYAGNEVKEEIIPFHSVNGVIPGFSNYSDIENQYGPPEEIEVQKKREVLGITVGGNKVIHYRSKGISFLVRKDLIIEGIYVEKPYKGRSPSGLFIGMSKNDAIGIIMENYHIVLGTGESLLIAKSDKHTDNFQVWFKNDVLTRMKLFGE